MAVFEVGLDMRLLESRHCPQVAHENSHNQVAEVVG